MSEESNGDVNALLLSEAEWLETAHANSEGRGYPASYRDGFASAAGWVRFHAETPHLIKDRPTGDLRLPDRRMDVDRFIYNLGVVLDIEISDWQKDLIKELLEKG